MTPKLPCKTCLTQPICISKFVATLTMGNNSTTYVLIDNIIDFCPKMKTFLNRHHKSISAEDKLKDVVEFFKCDNYLWTKPESEAIKIYVHKVRR